MVPSTLCLVTVLILNWNTRQVENHSYPVPCRDHGIILQVERIQLEHRQESQSVSHLIDSQLQLTTHLSEAEQGPRPYGQHYRQLLKESNRTFKRNREARYAFPVDTLYRDIPLDQLGNRTVLADIIDTKKGKQNIRLSLHS